MSERDRTFFSCDGGLEIFKKAGHFHFGGVFERYLYSKYVGRGGSKESENKCPMAEL